MKKVFANILLLIISLTCSYFISEFIVRSFKLSKTWQNNIGVSRVMKNTVMNNEVGYIRTPNSKFVGPLDVEYIINSDGFRDKQFTILKKKKRIGFLGDSVTEGFGVIDECRFSNLVEEKLKHDYEAYNFGIAGYSVWNELNVLKKYGLKYSPDIIFLQISLSQFLEDKKHLYHLSAKAPMSQPNRLKTFFQNNSALYLFFAEKYNYYKLKTGKSNNVLDLSIKLEQNDLLPTLNYIQEINNICVNKNIRFIASYIPTEAETLTEKTEFAYKINDFVESDCKKRGIEYLSTINSFRKEAKDLFLDNGHLTKKGNILVSTVILDYLKNKH